MILRETVRTCETCAATTPHAVEVHAGRWFARALIAGGVGFFVGLALFSILLAVLAPIVAGGLLSYGAAAPFARGRRCMRCAGRHVANRSRGLLRGLIEEPNEWIISGG